VTRCQAPLDWIQNNARPSQCVPCCSSEAPVTSPPQLPSERKVHLVCPPSIGPSARVLDRIHLKLPNTDLYLRSDSLRGCYISGTQMRIGSRTHAKPLTVRATQSEITALCYIVRVREYYFQGVLIASFYTFPFQFIKLFSNKSYLFLQTARPLSFDYPDDTSIRPMSINMMGKSFQLSIIRHKILFNFFQCTIFILPLAVLSSARILLCLCIFFLLFMLK
jgi:hypothetical protein